LFLRIPSDFPWPKFDQSTSIGSTNNSSRIPLSTITNQTSQIRSAKMKKTSTENILSPLPIIKTENHLPIVNSNNNHHQLFSTTNHNDFDGTSTIYSDQLEVSLLN